MVVGISGMIAAGKSSLTEKLHKHYDKSLLLHEFEEDDEVFNTFLKWLYENKPNLTIGFQSYIVENHSAKFEMIIEEFKKQKLDPKNDLILLDRFSIEHYVFAKLILSKKSMKYLQGYDALFQHLIRKTELPDFAIYLDISFDTFKKRIFERGRDSEVNNFEQNKAYFEELYANYFKIFKEIAGRFGLKYYVIDTNNLTEKEVMHKAIEIINNEIGKQC